MLFWMRPTQWGPSNCGCSYPPLVTVNHLWLSHTFKCHAACAAPFDRKTTPPFQPVFLSTLLVWVQGRLQEQDNCTPAQSKVQGPSSVMQSPLGLLLQDPSLIATVLWWFFYHLPVCSLTAKAVFIFCIYSAWQWMCLLKGWMKNILLHSYFPTFFFFTCISGKLIFTKKPT